MKVSLRYEPRLSRITSARYAASGPELTMTAPRADCPERSTSWHTTNHRSVTRTSQFTRLLVAITIPATD